MWSFKTEINRRITKMPTHYGKNIDVEIYGGSHDEQIGVIAKGLPVGTKIDYEKLLAFMARRAPGNDEFSTTRKEPDLPIFISGVEDNVIVSDTIHAIIKNTNKRSSDYDNLSFVPRPSHADFTAKMKYGDKVDLRGGGHYSGRLTAPMCIIGGICLQILEENNIFVGAHLLSVGREKDTPCDPVNITKKDIDELHSSSFPAINAEAVERMKNEILNSKKDGDSVGAVIECATIGLPVGLGEHMFWGVENRISSVVFGVPAVKGIEFGSGFEGATKKGSENNDPFYTDGISIHTRTNNCGGILGGITNGMPLVYRVAMKPTPSIYKEQQSVDMVSMQNVSLSIKGRHDPCVAVRAVPVVEAATAIAIFDMLLDNEK